MKKEVPYLLSLFILVNLLMGLLHAYSLSNNQTFLQPSNQDSGMVMLNIVSGNPEIFIHQPLNETYNYSYLQTNNYSILLNVSTNFAPDRLEYRLYDLKHGEILYADWSFNDPFMSDFYFLQNMEVVRYSSYLEVYAEDMGSGQNAMANVTFTIHVNNTAPVFDPIADEYFACEDSVFTRIPFRVFDRDEDVLDLGVASGLPFFDLGADVPPIQNGTLGSSGNASASNYIDYFDRYGDLFNVLHKRDTQTSPYIVTLETTDNEGHFSSKIVEINLIEMNNELNVSLGGSVFSVWAYGFENRSFEKQVLVSDEECDIHGLCDYVYNLSFLNGVVPFFSINASGWMNFTANENYLGPNNASKVYNLSLCVNDTALPPMRVHQNLSDICDPINGSSNQECLSLFQLVITAENRPPRFVNYYPLDWNFTANGETEIYFNATAFDPDGNSLDFRWYLDDAEQKFSGATLFDNFTYSFPCGVGGEHNVTVEVSDGLNSSSVVWNVSVSATACPQLEESGGGGGGGGGGGATTWFCDGDPEPCDVFYDAASCEGQSECSWNGDSCEGQVTGCLAFVDPFSCAEQEGCFWTRNPCERTWACYDWEACGNLQEGLGQGDVVGALFRYLDSACSENFWDENTCGYQKRDCVDIQFCGGNNFEVLSPMPGLVYTDSQITIEIIKDGEVSELRWNAGGYSEVYTDKVIRSFSEGSHELTVESSDKTGRKETRTYEFIIDSANKKATGDLAQLEFYEKKPGLPNVKPRVVQECYYLDNPTCFDGVKNCHSGGCETLIDCGGPCGACATCSDGLQNQGEQGIDCGGPCPAVCPAERPEGSNYIYLIAGISIAILGVLVFLIIRYIRLRKQEKFLTTSDKKI